MDLKIKITDEEFKNQLTVADDKSWPHVAPNSKVKLNLYSSLFRNQGLSKPCCRKSCASVISQTSEMSFLDEFQMSGDKKSFFSKYICVERPSRKRERDGSKNRRVTHRYYVSDVEVCLTYFRSTLGISDKYLRGVLKDLDAPYS